jgi:hypothetical protein
VRLVASIPNVRHHTVVRALLAGNWTYEPAGLLDRTHLQFFTLRTIEDLLREAGFTITDLGATRIIPTGTQRVNRRRWENRWGEIGVRSFFPPISTDFPRFPCHPPRPHFPTICCRMVGS